MIENYVAETKDDRNVEFEIGRSLEEYFWLLGKDIYEFAADDMEYYGEALFHIDQIYQLVRNSASDMSGIFSAIAHQDMRFPQMKTSGLSGEDAHEFEEWLDTFTHFTFGHWSVTEGKTGLAICRGFEYEHDANINAMTRIRDKGKSETLKAIEDGIKEHGLSPRYR